MSHTFPVFNYVQMFDINRLLDIQKENLIALAKIQIRTLAGLQKAGLCQAELISQMAKHVRAAMKEATSSRSPRQKIFHHTVIAEELFEKSAASWRELGDIISQSGNEALAILDRQAHGSMTEFQAVLAKRAAHAKRGALKNNATILKPQVVVKRAA